MAREFETIQIQSKREKMICDECGTQIKEYGHTWFNLEVHVGEWKDDCGEEKVYDFCDYKCMENFIKKHKKHPAAAHAELIKRVS